MAVEMVWVNKMFMIMVVTCVTMDSQDDHLGNAPGPPYSLPDLSRFGIRSTSPPPTYDRRLIKNNRRQTQKTTLTRNDNISNAYSKNPKHISGYSLKMEKHNVYENPKPKASQIHPFFETTSLNPVVTFKENALPKKSFVHKEPKMEKVQDMFFPQEVPDVQSFTLADAKTTNIQYQHEHLSKKYLEIPQ